MLRTTFGQRLVLGASYAWAGREYEVPGWAAKFENLERRRKEVGCMKEELLEIEKQEWVQQGRRRKVRCECEVCKEEE